MLLPNGSMIKNDVIECFNAAVQDEFNTRPGVGTTDFWNFVESDMYQGLRMFYNSEYIDACFEALADDFEGNLNLERIEILKKDFLGMEA
jgi:hypothetical protein